MTPDSIINKHDEFKLRHTRYPNIGMKIGQYIQTPPLFFTRDGHTIPLADKYRGGCAFLIAGGPSFANIDSSLLKIPGITTLGLNNSVSTFRPNLWTSVDPPSKFLSSIWLDQNIEKYVPYDHVEKPIWDSKNNILSDIVVGDCPNVTYFRRNEWFRANRYLTENSFNWGNHGQLGGRRSVLLIALKLLYILGFRRVFLLGVDFNMSKDAKYHFKQDRTDQSINNNQRTYEQMKIWFDQLRPEFESVGYHIHNCNKESELKAFDYMPFEMAIDIARSKLPWNLKSETTEGMYDKEVPKNKKKTLGELAAIVDSMHENIDSDLIKSIKLKEIELKIKKYKRKLKDIPDESMKALINQELMSLTRLKDKLLKPHL